MLLQTEYAEQILKYYQKLFEAGLLRLWWINKILDKAINIDDVTILKNTGLENDNFTQERFQNEIRKNILNCPDDQTYIKYFHYLIKIQWNLKENHSRYSKSLESFKDIKDKLENEYDEFPSYIFVNSKSKYYSLDELIGHCNYLIHSPGIFSILYHTILLEEFRYDLNKWKQHIADKKRVPTYNEVENLLKKENGKLENLLFNDESKNENPNNIEPLQEIDFEGPTQKIAWLYELGILELVMNKCKNGDTYNPYKSAKIINSFTGINIDTIRKCLEAIFKPNDNNKGNNPFTNDQNRSFVDLMKAKHKLK
jgi:hypothetical protein